VANEANRSAPPGTQLRVTTVDGVVVPPTRDAIRAYIAGTVTRITNTTARAGANPHHLLFDHQDQLDRFAAEIPEPERTAFVRIYTEELAAAVEAIRQEAERRELARIREDSRRVTILGFVAVVVAVLVISWIIAH